MTVHADPNRTLSVTRLIGAPPELVFRMFSTPEHLDAWWGPDGFTNETHEMDFSVGGLWRYTMHGPDGKDWPNWIRYREISPPTRLFYDHGAEIGEPAHFEGEISFEAEGDRTRVTLTLIFATTEARDATLKFGAVDGGNQTLAKLDAYLGTQAD
ncbi:MAG: SRPBCC family protein [Allorhizobium sp.]